MAKVLQCSAWLVQCMGQWSHLQRTTRKLLPGDKTSPSIL